jgi:hypothetical protein
MWIKEKCISFTFNKDEFLPNPDAAFFREFNITEYSNVARGGNSNNFDNFNNFNNSFNSNSTIITK